MEKIASFTIDHIKLQPGVYVSRKDHVGAEVLRSSHDLTERRTGHEHGGSAHD